MSDSIETVWMGTDNVHQLPDEVRDLMQKLVSKTPNQNDIEVKFFQIKNHLWYHYGLTLSNAKACYNASQLYQLEWWLLGDYAKRFGTLVFGRKLPTCGYRSPMRKFWIRRNNNAEFGDCTAGQLINTEIYDPLYFHDHGEALVLNQYSYGDGDIVYRHESAENKNPNWHYVSTLTLHDN